jgi:signal peptidase I
MRRTRRYRAGKETSPASAAYSWKSMAPATTSQAPSKPIVKTLAENVKETLESIVVAFILAFVFRAFIVEAFVIPTGSMAVTLYGNQVTKSCSTCGFEYALGITENQRAPFALPIRCPNCDTLYDKLEPREIDRPDSGDRILVHKWPFDVGGEWLGPHRWDVTVFKDPRDGTTNFIKRLVGLPGEVIEIIDGDVYAVPIKDLKPELVGKMDQLRLDVYNLRRPELQNELVNDNRQREGIKQQFLQRYAEINEQILPLLKIQRKLPHRTIAQESLWFSVYDHDFLPNYRPSGSTLGGSPVGWRASDAASGKAWNTSGREITFASDSPQPLEIQFSGKEIDDFYAYNLDTLPDRAPRPRQRVGDTRLRFVWCPTGGAGGIRLGMNRDEDDFIATINMDGQLRVEGYQPELETPGHRQVIGEKKLAAFQPGSAVPIEFINLDYRIALFVNNEEVIASTPEQYAPQLPRLRHFIRNSLREADGSGYVEVKPTAVRIVAHALQCQLRHVVLQRDVYYRSQQQAEDSAKDATTSALVYNPYARWPGWATAGLPIMLRSSHDAGGRKLGGEYLMLGDNSPASKDSRLWWEIGPHLRRLGNDYQVGTVPEDQLIGKAFFVYWPAGYRPSWSPNIGLIPNFGRMRWIR